VRRRTKKHNGARETAVGLRLHFQCLDSRTQGYIFEWLDAREPAPTSSSQRPLHGCVPLNFKFQIQTSEIMVQSAKMALQNIGIVRPDLKGSGDGARFALLTGWRNG
jgi:hypothetical protein